jgi:hypothetical protein
MEFSSVESSAERQFQAHPKRLARIQPVVADFLVTTMSFSVISLQYEIREGMPPRLWLHAHRTAGRYRRHCHPGGHIIAGLAVRQSQSPGGRLRQQLA